mmetsp:Transcript_47483/g.135534  ORF Transcript_47483/g.135534 Transcript_47483/m.135534 type:complete len:271 (+) Transcript_47483:142-954(+)
MPPTPRCSLRLASCGCCRTCSSSGRACATMCGPCRPWALLRSATPRASPRSTTGSSGWTPPTGRACRSMGPPARSSGRPRAAGRWPTSCPRQFGRTSSCMPATFCSGRSVSWAVGTAPRRPVWSPRPTRPMRPRPCAWAWTTRSPPSAWTATTRGWTPAGAAGQRQRATNPLTARPQRVPHRQLMPLPVETAQPRTRRSWRSSASGSRVSSSKTSATVYSTTLMTSRRSSSVSSRARSRRGLPRIRPMTATARTTRTTTGRRRRRGRRNA